jgi:hypothetical protein
VNLLPGAAKGAHLQIILNWQIGSIRIYLMTDGTQYMNSWKGKFQHRRLTDPFEKYLHDTYFPRREKASKKNTSASKSANSSTVQQVILLIFAISWMVH